MATAVYMRVSSKSQKIRSQRREIERYLSANGIGDACWFIDDGISGATMDRPALDKLEHAIFMGEVDTLVVHAPDRLARDAVEGMLLLADWLIGAAGLRAGYGFGVHVHFEKEQHCSARFRVRDRKDAIWSELNALIRILPRPESSVD